MRSKKTLMHKILNDKNIPYTLIDIEREKLIPYPCANEGFLNRKQLQLQVEAGILKPDYTKGNDRVTKYFFPETIKKFAWRMADLTLKNSKEMPWIKLSNKWCKENNYK